MPHTLISLPTYTTAAMAHDLLAARQIRSEIRQKQQLRIQYKNRQQIYAGSAIPAVRIRISDFEDFTDKSLIFETRMVDKQFPLLYSRGNFHIGEDIISFCGCRIPEPFSAPAYTVKTVISLCSLKSGLQNDFLRRSIPVPKPEPKRFNRTDLRDFSLFHRRH